MDIDTERDYDRPPSEREKKRPEDTLPGTGRGAVDQAGVDALASAISGWAKLQPGSVVAGGPLYLSDVAAHADIDGATTVTIQLQLQAGRGGLADVVPLKPGCRVWFVVVEEE